MVKSLFFLFRGNHICVPNFSVKKHNVLHLVFTNIFVCSKSRQKSDKKFVARWSLLSVEWLTMRTDSLYVQSLIHESGVVVASLDIHSQSNKLHVLFYTEQ